MNIRFLVGFLWLLVSFPVQAQLGKESWHWQFGYGAGLDFSSGVPVAVHSAISAESGSASVSDASTGALLFYTDGMTIWNKNNLAMPNGTGLLGGNGGVGGNGGATQSALIVLQPGTTNFYYVFTSDQGFYTGTQGVHYSIVDRNLNGGLGDVTVKNTLLTAPPATEKLTAVRHCNGKDIWIITRPDNDNAFYAYLLTASGISTVPVVSHAGTVQQVLQDGCVGYLKASPNGRKLAYAIEYVSVFELVDFDNGTGLVSNPITVTYSGGYGTNGALYPYGIAFSPDNSQVYVSDWKGYVFQYSLNSGNAASIIASQRIVHSGVLGLGALQLGPDGNIYLTSYANFYLSVIKNPNSTTSTFLKHGIDLLPGDSCSVGLPNFADLSTPPVNYNPVTVGLCPFTADTLHAAGGYTSYLWSTADTTSSTVIHAFGNYGMTGMAPDGCKVIDSFFVRLIPPPRIHLLSDTVVCSDTPVALPLDATYPNTLSYSWSDGFTQPKHVLPSPGLYWVNYTLTDFCTARDSFLFVIDSVPPVHLSRDSNACRSSAILLANTSLPVVWSGGSKGPQLEVTQDGNYTLTVTGAGGCRNSETIAVKFSGPPVIPNIVTPNSDGTNDRIDFGKYGFVTLHLEIFNRWGYPVYKSDDPACVWKPDNVDGTYYWIAYYTDCPVELENKVLRGFVTIIKN